VSLCLARTKAFDTTAGARPGDATWSARVPLDPLLALEIKCLTPVTGRRGRRTRSRWTAQGTAPQVVPQVVRGPRNRRATHPPAGFPRRYEWR